MIDESMGIEHKEDSDVDEVLRGAGNENEDLEENNTLSSHSDE